MIIFVEATFKPIIWLKGMQSSEMEIYVINQLQVGWEIVKSIELIFGGF